MSHQENKCVIQQLKEVELGPRGGGGGTLVIRGGGGGAYTRYKNKKIPLKH